MSSGPDSIVEVCKAGMAILALCTVGVFAFAFGPWMLRQALELLIRAVKP